MVYWNDDLLVGVKEIDDQHKELCEMSAKIFQAFVSGNISDNILSYLAYFVRYANEHFDLEERLQIKINYPYYKEHKSEHQKFKTAIDKFITEVKETSITPELITKFNEEVINWLIFHFRECDGQLSEFIQNDTERINDHYMTIAELMDDED